MDARTCDACGDLIATDPPAFQVVAYRLCVDYDICCPACLEDFGAKLQNEVCS